MRDFQGCDLFDLLFPLPTRFSQTQLHCEYVFGHRFFFLGNSCKIGRNQGSCHYTVCHWKTFQFVYGTWLNLSNIGKETGLDFSLVSSMVRAETFHFASPNCIVVALARTSASSNTHPSHSSVYWFGAANCVFTLISQDIVLASILKIFVSLRRQASQSLISLDTEKIRENVVSIMRFRLRSSLVI